MLGTCCRPPAQTFALNPRVVNKRVAWVVTSADPNINLPSGINIDVDKLHGNARH